MAWKKYPIAVLAVLLLVHMLAHVDRNMLLGFSPQVIADLSLSDSQFGFLVGAVWVLSVSVVAVFMGAMADRYSRPKVMGLGILIWSVCTAASGLAQNFEQMATARFLVASGEAALVPAALSLLIELFPERHRGTASGVFFMGIPLGIGLSFLIAGSAGVSLGWRGIFYVLGVIGIVIALPLLLIKDERGVAAVQQRSISVWAHLRLVLANLRGDPAVVYAILGFVLVHMVFAGMSFTQLWLVRERGLDAANIARTIGGLQIVAGTLGALVGGVLSDRLARRLPGGYAGFMVLLIALCGPLMIGYRFAPTGSALFYVGMCAGFFLPLAIYGPANALIQGRTPAHMRSTVTGFAVLLINVFAIAVGNMAIGIVSDRMTAAGSHSALGSALLVTDLLTISSGFLFALAARGRGGSIAVQPSPTHQFNQEFLNHESISTRQTGR